MFDIKIGRNRLIRQVKLGSAVIAGALTLLTSVGANAAPADPGCGPRPVSHRISPGVEYVTRGNAPRFLASRSTKFLATRDFNVLAAPHQLAPKSTVVYVPGRLVPPCRGNVGHRAAIGPAIPPTVQNSHGYAPNRAPICRVVRTGSK
jgi:hypothetical protein